MNITITGKEVKATDAIKDYVEKKMERVEKYFDGDIDVSVTIKTEGVEQIAEMAVKVKQDSYRAVTAHKDMYASIDKDIDILEGQIRKWKTKKDKANKEDSIKALNNLPTEGAVENEIKNEKAFAGIITMLTNVFFLILSRNKYRSCLPVVFPRRRACSVRLSQIRSRCRKGRH